MKYEYTSDWVYKHPNEKFQVEFSFANDLATSETLSSMTATITNIADDTDVSSSMLSSITTSTPKGYLTISKGESDETYQIKVAGVSNDSHTFVHYVICEVFGTTTLTTKLGTADSNSYLSISEMNTYARNKRGHNNVFDTLSLEGRKRLLIQAANEMELHNYIDEQYYPDAQNLQFPRDTSEVVEGGCATPFSINSFTHSDLYSTTYNEIPANHWHTCHIVLGTPLRDTRLISSSDVSDGTVTMKTDFTATPNANTDFVIFAKLDKEILDAQAEQVLFILDNINMETLSSYQTMGAKSVEIGDVKIDFNVSGGQTARVGISPEAKKLLSRWIKRSLRVLRA